MVKVLELIWKSPAEKRCKLIKHQRQSFVWKNTYDSITRTRAKYSSKRERMCVCSHRSKPSQKNLYCQQTRIRSSISQIAIFIYLWHFYMPIQNSQKVYNVHKIVQVYTNIIKIYKYRAIDRMQKSIGLSIIIFIVWYYQKYI